MAVVTIILTFTGKSYSKNEQRRKEEHIIRRRAIDRESEARVSERASEREKRDERGGEGEK